MGLAFSGQEGEGGLSECTQNDITTAQLGQFLQKHLYTSVPCANGCTLRVEGIKFIFSCLPITKMKQYPKVFTILKKSSNNIYKSS